MPGRGSMGPRPGTARHRRMPGVEPHARGCSMQPQVQERILRQLTRDFFWQLEPTYVHGIRVYRGVAVLKPHRDRQETHVVSAIINVDQETNSEWPLFIEDNCYRGHEVLLKPGEVLFYEGSRLMHGRPTPLDGASYANIFCHYRLTAGAVSAA